MKLKTTLLLALGTMLYAAALPDLIEQRGGFYIGGEVFFLVAPVLFDYFIRDIRSVIRGIKEE